MDIDPSHGPVPGPALIQRASRFRALGEPHRLAIIDALRLSDRTPSELAVLTGLATNLLAFHINVLQEAGLLERRPSEGDARRRYVRLRPDALRDLNPPLAIRVDEVLFVCTRNSARSQLAAALWERETGRAAWSAGNDPAPAVHEQAVAVAAAHGLDLSAARPQGLAAVADLDVDLVVSVCDRARETGWPLTAPDLHWSVPDPVRGGVEDFETAYELLDAHVRTLAAARQLAA